MKLKSLESMLALGAVAARFAQPALSAATMWLTGIAISSATARHAMAPTALGDGPVAKTLVTPPANLRKLGDKYGMPLPAHKIAEFIDGRDTPRAHGSHEMPVWGEKLYEMGAGREGRVRDR